jgi:hypothetical protein
MIKCNVVLLETHKGFEVDESVINLCSPVDGSLKSYYVYLTSDDKIFDGDWFFSNYYNSVQKHRGDADLKQFGNMFQKIIATTDPSILSEKNNIYKIPNSFLQNCIAKEGKIDSVFLSFESKEKFNIFEVTEFDIINMQKAFNDGKLYGDNELEFLDKFDFSNKPLLTAFDVWFEKTFK